jgi:hypothetical protein
MNEMSWVTSFYIKYNKIEILIWRQFETRKLTVVYPYSAHEVRNASETVQRNRQKYSFSMVFDETEPQTTFHKGSRHIYKYLKLHTPKGLRVCIHWCVTGVQYTLVHVKAHTDRTRFGNATRIFSFQWHLTLILTLRAEIGPNIECKAAWPFRSGPKVFSSLLCDLYLEERRGRKRGKLPGALYSLIKVEGPKM